MVDIDDPGGLRKRLERQLRLLRRAGEVTEKNESNSVSPISVEDKETIIEFLHHLQANKDNKSQSNANHIKHLRLTAQRCETSLNNMEKHDLDRFTVRMTHDRELSKKTINNYKGSWKPFFRYLSRSWAEDIEFYNLNSNEEVESWKVYSEEEVNKMLELADGRETAAIALLADTGSRIGAVSSIYRKGLDLSGEVAVVSLNERAPLKGAEGNIPLTWSRSYIVNYLHGDHPRPNKDEAALIHKKESFDECDSGALQSDELRRGIKEIMADAGIGKKRRRPHNFRHTAVTRWLRMGISKDVIKYRTKWADMSMLDRYSHLHEDDKIRMTAEEFGLIQPGDTADTSRPEDVVGSCPQCDTTIRVDSRYCPGCGNPITVDAAHNEPPSDIKKPAETGDELIKFDQVQEEMTAASVLEQLLNQHPELLDQIDFEDNS